MFQNKIVDFDQLPKRLAQWRIGGNSIVFTNGCFDILHAGHLKVLEQSSKLGDKLIVAINSDSSVKKLKGENRPIKSEDERALLIAAFGMVDAIVIFEEETPKRLIEMIKPDFLVKGGDYTKEQIVGATVVEENGGEIIIIPLIEGKSSSYIINTKFS